MNHPETIVIVTFGSKIRFFEKTWAVSVREKDDKKPGYSSSRAVNN